MKIIENLQGGFMSKLTELMNLVSYTSYSNTLPPILLLLRCNEF